MSIEFTTCKTVLWSPHQSRSIHTAVTGYIPEIGSWLFVPRTGEHLLVEHHIHREWGIESTVKRGFCNTPTADINPDEELFLLGFGRTGEETNPPPPPPDFTEQAKNLTVKILKELLYFLEGRRYEE